MAVAVPKENTVIFKIYSLREDEDFSRLRGAIINELACYLAPYIWQKESFNLSFINNYLYGEVDFDENIEDEWFIVFLLFHISKTFQSLFIEVYDEDGQFLLIEAADYLPDWMSPEICDHRVYIHLGKLHALSPTVMPVITNPFEACKIIAQNSEQTSMALSVVRCIFKRISEYPGLILRNQQAVNCFIPANLAYMLTERPQLISVGVNSFCDSIIIKRKSPKIMSFFKPTNRVLYRVTMTRCQYAQLMFHRFSSDRKGGWATPDLISTIGHKALDLGTKLAYGFEFACANAQSINKIQNGSCLDSGNIISSKEYDRFLASLNKNGYFRGLMEGSQEYNRLINQARCYFGDTLMSKKGGTSDTSSQVLLGYLQQASKIDVEKIKRANINLPPDDDDGWLNDFEYSLHSISERAGYTHNGTSNGKSTNGSHVPIDDLVTKMNRFVNKLSSAVDGVEVGGENGFDNCPHMDSESNSDSDEETTDRTAKTEAGSYMKDFIFASDEYSGDDADSSLDEDYATDQHMKQLMRQMDGELKKAKQIGRDEVRTRASEKVLASNLRKSCQEEGSRPGPTGVLLKQLNIKMPTLCQPDSDDSD